MTRGSLRIAAHMMPPTPSALLETAERMDVVWATLAELGHQRPSLVAELDLWQRAGCATLE